MRPRVALGWCCRSQRPTGGILQAHRACGLGLCWAIAWNTVAQGWNRRCWKIVLCVGGRRALVSVLVQAQRSSQADPMHLLFNTPGAVQTWSSCPGPLCIKERGKSKRVYFFFSKKGLIDDEYKLPSPIDLLFELEPEHNLSPPAPSSGETTTCSGCTGTQALGPLSGSPRRKKY